MPLEKKDGRNGADNANADFAGIFVPKQRFPDHSRPEQLSAPSREQNLAGLLRAYSQERSSELASRPACCFSSPIQEPASRNRASPDVHGAAAFPSKSDGCKAAGLKESEPGLRSPGEYCRT